MLSHIYIRRKARNNAQNLFTKNTKNNYKNKHTGTQRKKKKKKMTSIWTKIYNHKTNWNRYMGGLILSKNIFSFINVDVFKSFDLLLHDIILLNVSIVGHAMLPK